MLPYNDRVVFFGMYETVVVASLPNDTDFGELQSSSDDDEILFDGLPLAGGDCCAARRLWLTLNDDRKHIIQ